LVFCNERASRRKTRPNVDNLICVANGARSAEHSNPTNTIPTVIPEELRTASGNPWSGSPEQTLWRNQLRLSTQLLIRLDTELTEKHGLTIADFTVLVVIAEGPEEGVRMSSVAEYVMISRSRLTHCVDRLEARGLVERSKASDDRRGFRCLLKPKGRRLLAEAVPTHVAGVRHYFADLVEPDEFDVIDRFIRRVLGALGAPGGPVPNDGHITIDDYGPR
jgi:DNA-binding MarR family transcriptional regulator